MLESTGLRAEVVGTAGSVTLEEWSESAGAPPHVRRRGARVQVEAARGFQRRAGRRRRRSGASARPRSCAQRPQEPWRRVAHRPKLLRLAPAGDDRGVVRRFPRRRRHARLGAEEHHLHVGTEATFTELFEAWAQHAHTFRNLVRALHLAGFAWTERIGESTSGPIPITPSDSDGTSAFGTGLPARSCRTRCRGCLGAVRIGSWAQIGGLLSPTPSLAQSQIAGNSACCGVRYRSLSARYGRSRSSAGTWSKRRRA